jgi:carbamoyltransferase
VAAALQKRVEEVVLGWIEARRRGRGSIAVAGGLFANVALNGKLATRFDDLYVFPHMGDGGLCLGAAVAASGLIPFGIPFTGPEYSEQLMRAAIKRAGLTAERPVDPERCLIEAIADGLLVARFVGGSEFGPRALGHRSILLRADQPALADKLNEQLKRDEFMPFAPIRRFGAGSSTMTVVVDADSELRDRCPAAVHIDGTARTQIVNEQADPGLWRLLEGAESLGFPALINTSFNRHGEPIVETPEDAIATFLAAQLDRMQMGPFIVRRVQ